MNDAAVLYMPNLTNLSSEQRKNLSLSIHKEKDKVIEQMKLKLDQFKLQLLQDALESREIPYNPNIDNYYELRKYIIDSDRIPKEKKQELYNVADLIDSEVNKLLDELVNGSTTALDRFIRNTYTKIVKPVGKSVINGLAVSSLLQMAPTLELKLGVIAASLGVSSIKLIKTLKARAYQKSNAECDKALKEMEITKKDGKIVDTRFPESVVQVIKDYFKDHNIAFEDTGYLSVRETLYNLDYEQKLELTRILISKTGREINIDERIKKYNEDFTTFVSNNVIKPITIGGATGISIATVINGVAPEILATPLNTFIARYLTAGKLPEVLSWAITATTGAISGFGKYIPVVGKWLEKTMAAENIATLAVIGGVVGLAAHIGKKIYKGVSSAIEERKRTKEEKEIQKIEIELYEKDIEEELKKIQEILNENGKNPTSAMIIEIVCEYLENEEGIKFAQKPRTIYELSKKLETVDEEVRKKVVVMLRELMKFNKDKPTTFQEKVKDVARKVITTIALGLAGLNVYDLITGKGILKRISQSDLFKGIPGTRLEQIPIKQEDIAELESKMVENDHKLNPTPTPPATGATGTPGPDATPTPQPTPTPVGTMPPMTEAPIATPTPAPNGSPTGTPLPGPAQPVEIPDRAGLITAIERQDPKLFFKVFNHMVEKFPNVTNESFMKDIFAGMDKETAEIFLKYMNGITLTDEEAKAFKIAGSTLLNKIAEINLAIEEANRKIENLNNIFNGVIAGEVLANTAGEVQKGK